MPLTRRTHVLLDERRDSLAESRRRWIDAIAPILGDDGCSVDDVPSRIEAYRASVEAPLRAEIERLTTERDALLAARYAADVERDTLLGRAQIAPVPGHTIDVCRCGRVLLSCRCIGPHTPRVVSQTCAGCAK